MVEKELEEMRSSMQGESMTLLQVFYRHMSFKLKNKFKNKRIK